jgi:hypothetical protein
MSEPIETLVQELRALCEWAPDNDECECTVCDAAFWLEYNIHEIRKWRGIAERLVESEPRFDGFHAYFREVINK